MFLQLRFITEHYPKPNRKQMTQFCKQVGYPCVASCFIIVFIKFSCCCVFQCPDSDKPEDNQIMSLAELIQVSFIFHCLIKAWFKLEWGEIQDNLIGREPKISRLTEPAGSDSREVMRALLRELAVSSTIFISQTSICRNW